jgi:hypothetical protein
VIEWYDGLHAKLIAEAIAAKLEQGARWSWGVAQSIGDVDRGMASAVTTPEATYHSRMQTPERLFMARGGSRSNFRTRGVSGPSLRALYFFG